MVCAQEEKLRLVVEVMGLLGSFGLPVDYLVPEKLGQAHGGNVCYVLDILVESTFKILEVCSTTYRVSF